MTGESAASTPTASRGGERNRTAVRGFAGRCLNHSATPPGMPGDNDTHSGIGSSSGGYGRRAPMPAAAVDLRPLQKTQRITLAAAVGLTAIAGLAVAVGASDVTRFVLAGLALAAVAALVGQSIEQVGERLGPGATGVLQSTLGNLPELFVALFALDKGLIDVVQAALIGSVLGNVLLVLGCAFVAGGLRHGTQRFDPEEPRLNASLLLLVVAALLVPTLAYRLHTPAAAHISVLSDACGIALLIVYAATLPFYLRRRELAQTGAAETAPVQPQPSRCQPSRWRRSRSRSSRVRAWRPSPGPWRFR